MFILYGKERHAWTWFIAIWTAVIIIHSGLLSTVGMSDQQKSVAVMVLIGVVMIYAVIASMKHQNDSNPVDVVPPPLVESDESPVGVRKAVKVLWLLLAVDAVNTIIDLSVGHASMLTAVLSIIPIGLFCIFPYKIGNGSNAARYGYFVVNCLGYALVIAGALIVDTTTPSPCNTLDYIMDLVEVPFFTYAYWNLFQPDANKWFTAKKH